jgi:hypothetical protein
MRVGHGEDEEGGRGEKGREEEREGEKRGREEREEIDSSKEFGSTQ